MGERNGLQFEAVRDLDRLFSKKVSRNNVTAV